MEIHHFYMKVLHRRELSGENLTRAKNIFADSSVFHALPFIFKMSDIISLRFHF